MLHTKFRGNRSNGSGEDFRGIYTVYGCGGNLGHVANIMSINIHFLVPKNLHTKFGYVVIFICE